MVVLSMILSLCPSVHMEPTLHPGSSAFEEQSLAACPRSFTWPRLVEGASAGFGGLMRAMDIPVYWLFKGQRPAPLLYRLAHLFPKHLVSRKMTVQIGFVGAIGESIGLALLIRHVMPESIPAAFTVFLIAGLGAILHLVMRRHDRDITRRYRHPWRYTAAQFTGLLLFVSLLLTPIPWCVPVALNLYVQFRHFFPKWHPTTAEEARRYAADLETYRGKEIDFIRGIFVPMTARQWWAYIHLMNVPVKALLYDLERLDRNTRRYKLTSIALILNYRLVDVRQLEARYARWIKRGWTEKASDLQAWKLGMLYAGLPQKQITAYNVRSPVVAYRAYRGRYPEVLRLLLWRLKRFLKEGATGPLDVLEYGMSDGSFTQDAIEELNKEKVRGVRYEATDIVTSFSVVKGLYTHGRYADYAFIFKSDGQLMQALSPEDEGRTWIRWILTIYIPPLLRIMLNGRKTWSRRILKFLMPPLVGVILNYVITFMTGIELGEWRVPIHKIEEEWTAIQNGAQAPPKLSPKQVSTIRPELAAYEKACQIDPAKDPFLVTGAADVFKDPQKRPAQSEHVIIVNGLLMRNNEYFGAQEIKHALGELGRLLVEGGILINATRGSVYAPKKLYMDVYKRVGDFLILIKTQGYKRDGREPWQSDPAWDTKNWKLIPVAKNAGSATEGHSHQTAFVLAGSA
jgi:hypothetical protein